ncbi:MAG: type II toxin-antitoxin system VapC family toxin [Pseudonocardiaceae bacterium]
MTVFDASVLVNALVVGGPDGDETRKVLRDRSVLPVPSIFVAEATSAIRSMLARGEVSSGLVCGAVTKIKIVRTVQYPIEPFVDRVWKLPDNLSMYDGWYVALAESLETNLVTADHRLAKASGPRYSVLEVAQFAARSSGSPARAAVPERSPLPVAPFVTHRCDRAKLTRAAG